MQPPLESARLAAPTDPTGLRHIRHPLLRPLASLAALQGLLALVTASTLRHVGTYDTASYYVVARNLAQGRGLTDTVIWQLLGAPETVQRPAGDYWEVGWPLFLGTLMSVFGHSERAAIFLCAALSMLLPVMTAIVAWLVGKRVGPAFLAGLLVTLQARLLPTDVTPDATLFYQLTCLSGLAALLWVHERPAPSAPPTTLLAVGAALALPMHVRGEGFLLAATALPLLLLAGPWPPRERLRRAVWAALGIALVGLPFLLRNLLVLGRAMPEGRVLRLWMTSYDDLFRFGSDPSPSTFWAQGLTHLAGLRRDALAAHLHSLTHQIPWPLLPLAATGALAHRRSPREWALALFVAASLLVPCLAVPVIASIDRFCMNVLPVLCVAAALGLFALRDALVSRAPLAPAKARALDAAVLGGGALAAVTLFAGPVGVRGWLASLDAYRALPAFVADDAGLAHLHLAPADVVLTDEPWRVAAILDVATVVVPLDGPAAVDALVTRYRPRYVVTGFGRPVRRFVTANLLTLRPVLSTREGVWYERPDPIRNADGSVAPR